MKTTAEGAALGSCEPAAGRPAHRGFNRLLYWRLYPGLFHVLLYAALAILIFFAFYPARRAEGNLATEVVWKLWWPGLPFILLLAGRFWCGVCPFGGVSDLAARMRKIRPAPPTVMRRWGPWLGALSVFGFGMAFLALGLEGNTRATGFILIGMVGLAFGMSLLYRGRTFCRYLCPVGMITRVYSFFSWLVPRGSRVRYQAAACPVGQSPESLRQPSQCQLCGTCTNNGVAGGINTTFSPRINGSLGLRATAGAGGGGAAITGTGWLPGPLEFGRAEAGLSLLLLGLMAADSVRMTSLFARFQQFALPYFNYNYRLTVVVGVSSLVGAVLALQLAGSWLSSRRDKGARAFEGIAFTYLPLTLGVFLSLALQHLRYGIWPSLQTVLAESRIIDWDGHMPPTNVYFTSIPLKSVQFALLGVGLYLSWRLTRSGLASSSEGSSPGGAGSGGTGSAGIVARRFMLLTAAAGFGFLFLLPMSGAC